MAKAIAKALLEIEAVSLSPNDPFTWFCIKSPIYCDNRVTLDICIRQHIEMDCVN